MAAAAWVIGAAVIAMGATAHANKKASKPPEPKKPTVMPLGDDDAASAARRRSLTAQASRSGRQSTILTDQDNTLG